MQNFSIKKKLTFQQKGQMLNRVQTINPNVNREIIVRSGTTVNIGGNIDNTISKPKENEIELNTLNSKTTAYENEFLNQDLDTLFENLSFQARMSKIYRGYNPDVNFTRVLLISHGGFIMEFLNNIRQKKNIRIKFINDSKPTGLYIIKIYCNVCGPVCYSKDDNCKIELDTILFNDADHLGSLVPLKEGNYESINI
jgi:hypothetical protein